jgi:hypothetical protein
MRNLLIHKCNLLSTVQYPIKLLKSINKRDYILTGLHFVKSIYIRLSIE